MPAQQHASIYQQMGGAEGVRAFVETFCQTIETTEVGRPVLILHLRGHGMAHARMEQFNFFSGLFGGPRLYAEKWGHSNVRQIHAHVQLGEAEVTAWLSCMAITLDKLDYPAALKQQLMDNFTPMARLLINQ